jgi:hypothetical protein
MVALLILSTVVSLSLHDGLATLIAIAWFAINFIGLAAICDSGQTNIDPVLRAGWQCVLHQRNFMPYKPKNHAVTI